LPETQVVRHPLTEKDKIEFCPWAALEGSELPVPMNVFNRNPVHPAQPSYVISSFFEEVFWWGCVIEVTHQADPNSFSVHPLLWAMRPRLHETPAIENPRPPV
jgi:hypothetical protein